ncbi:hypothetical protein MBLNU457_7553t1 [Dothideomycetes sp. NU457]
MFTNKASWRAVAITVFLHACGILSSGYLWSEVEERFKNNVPKEALDQDDIKDDAASLDPKSFLEETLYTRDFPQRVFIDFLLQILCYQWQCWLERTFPTRPRQKVDVQQLREKDKHSETSEEMEEVIMQKLIAQGKVKRGGVSWVNIGLKWALDNILGVLIYGAFYEMIEGVIKWRSLLKIWSRIKWSPVSSLASNFFGITPLVSVISYLVIPVEHRLPFTAGISLAFEVFFGALACVVMPWFLSLDAVQEGIRNGTEVAKMQKSLMEAQATAKLSTVLALPPTSTAVLQVDL